MDRGEEGCTHAKVEDGKGGLDFLGINDIMEYTSFLPIKYMDFIENALLI